MSRPFTDNGATMIKLIDVTDNDGRLVETLWLSRAESVHRQLRPQLPADYATKMQRVFAGGGRMMVAARDDVVTGVAVWRVHENTHSGVHMYVDDLVTDEARRSTGVGHALMESLRSKARELRCKAFTLDSGTQRQQAHKFYFREGMVVTAFHFDQAL
jgi:GNAT superfamily N-acetyltransferase